MQNNKPLTTFIDIFAYLVLFFTCLYPNTAQAQQYGTIMGKVTDGNEPLMGATISVVGGNSATATDLDGNYKLKLATGKYSIVIASVGYTSKTINDIVIVANATVTLHVQLLEDAQSLDEVMVTSMSAPKKKTNDKAKPQESKRIDADLMPASSQDSKGRAAPMPAPKPMATKENTNCQTTNATLQTAPAVSYNWQPTTTVGAANKSSVPTSSPPPPPTIVNSVNSNTTTNYPITANAEVPVQVVPSAKAGLLTAGEVNDFTKWEMWQDITTDILENEQAHWQFRAIERYAVQLTTEGGDALVDQAVSLVSDAGQTVWQARTDNTGKAELWANLFSTIPTNAQFSIQTTFNRKSYTISRAVPFAGGINTLALPAKCEPSSNIDIMFVVDATNSMLDEINYLRTELDDIINRTQKQHKDLSINLGSVFYTDFGDPNMIRVSPFSTKIKNTIDFMNRQQNFTGGYDWPEAVDSALAVALHQQKWSEKARTRLLFLIADAPSRDDAETLERMHQVTAKAAAMGIRIIPVACSGTPKSAEYLFRCLALATNGTYTFLTNDSGIGNDHIKPTTDHYDVTTINNLLVQIIDQFTETTPCNQTYLPNQATANVTVELPPSNNNNNNKTETNKFVCYPNPTNGKLTVELKGKFEFLFLADANGKILQRYAIQNQEQIELDLSNYPAGIYFVQCPTTTTDQWATGRIVLIR